MKTSRRMEIQSTRRAMRPGKAHFLSGAGSLDQLGSAAHSDSASANQRRVASRVLVGSGRGPRTHVGTLMCVLTYQLTNAYAGHATASVRMAASSEGRIVSITKRMPGSRRPSQKMGMPYLSHADA